MALSREQILTAKDIETVEVDCPEWGGSVRVRALTAKEVAQYRRGLSKLQPEKNTKTGRIESSLTVDLDWMQSAAVRLVAMAAVDDDGQKLFPVDSDIEALAGRSFKPIERISNEVIRISGMGQASDEEAEKN